jgi:hypothetical protein
MILRELSGGAPDAEVDIAALAGKLFVIIFGTVTNLFDRLPSSHHVLHYHPTGIRETQHQALGRFEAQGAA